MIDTERIPCIHCGKLWGGHYGAYCYHQDNESGDKFQPKGVNLSDICSHCGKPFEDHLSRIYCRDFNIFTKKEYTLEEELFEV